MMKNCTFIQGQREELISTYNRMAEKQRMKEILTDQNISYEEMNVILR